MLRIGTSIVILPFMVTELKLEKTELMIYAIIFGCSQDGCSIYRSGLQYLSEWTRESFEEVSNCLKSLVEKRFIEPVKLVDEKYQWGYRAIL